jgi:two-component system, OmpR family, KDP operon response regulator KdpE
VSDVNGKIERERRSVPMSTAKILVVEDDPQARRALRTTLASSGYTVIEARTGEEAWEEFQVEGTVDVILLKMPGVGGLEACRRIRTISTVPILGIGVGRTRNEKVQAFDAGADDYLVKPFGIQELLSQIYALRRRAFGSEVGQSFESDELKIDFERRRVSVGSQTNRLTPTEFKVLRYLVLHEGKPVDYRILLQSLWGVKHTSKIHILRSVINQLRRKIELHPARFRYIHTEHKFGYRFEAMPQKSAKRKRKT